MADIVLRAEAVTYLGKGRSMSESDLGLLNLLHPLVEARVKDFLGFDVALGEYLEFYPESIDDTELDEFADLDVTRSTPTYLRLRNKPVTSIIEVRVYDTAYGVEAGFPDSSVVDADNYYLAGKDLLVAQSGWWPSTPGSVMVRYTGGLTRAELNGKYGAIKLGTLQAISENFHAAKYHNVSLGGSLRMERYPEHEAQYGPPGSGKAIDVTLSDSVKRTLEPHIRYRLT